MSATAIGDALTLVAGATFAVSDMAGEFRPGTWQGLYHRDARVLSRMAVRLDGRPPGLLASHRVGGSVAHHVLVAATEADGSPTALLLRRRSVAGEVRERFELRAFGEAVDVELRVDVEVDFADLLALKAAPGDPPEAVPWVLREGGLHAEQDGFAVTVRVAEGEADVRSGAVTFRARVEAGGSWSGELVVRPWSSRDGPAATTAGRPPAGRVPGGPDVASPATRWPAGVRSALSDLAALRVEVPALGLAYIGAGAPWYMALFGRDTLISAWEALVTGPEVALDVLTSLARFQGRRDAAGTGEQPGRILHELRSGRSEVFGVPSGSAYYGTVDATPLFVALLGEAHRWGADPDAVADLLPAARAAMTWCVERGDLDGDGYIEYDADPGGLVNQGWKDSDDAMVHADGSPAHPPIALAEVQAYLWAAYRALAGLEQRVGDPARAGGLRDRADRLRAAFRRDFWLPDAGVVAMGLDAGKRPLAVASSNMGHCLWAGLLDEDVGAAVARRVAQPDLSTRWGLRTLASTEAAYNPLSYHRGSIWPHDTAIAAAGLARYGRAELAAGLADGLLAAADTFGGRLPELFAGLDAEEAAFPVRYPVACDPQAWSAAVPLLLLRTVLGLEPDVPAGRLRVAPALPGDVELTVTGIGLGVAGSLDLRARGGEAEILSAPAGLDIEVRPNP